MSDWSLDLIRPRTGESRAAAVDRVYAGGVVLELGNDDAEHDGLDDTSVVDAPAEPVDVERVSRPQRAAMLETLELLDQLDVGLELVESLRAGGRRWPYRLILESEAAGMRLDVYTEWIELRTTGISIDQQWQLWWRVLRGFGQRGYFVYDSNGGDILRIPTSFGAARAREYFWIF